MSDNTNMKNNGLADGMMTTAQHEKEMTRLETANKRWFISFMVVLSMLFLTNAGWVYYESLFQDVVVTNEADSGEGGSAIALGTGVGDLYYGTRETNDQDPGEAKQ